MPTAEFNPSARRQRHGRPRKHPDELRNVELRLYLTLPEKERIEEDARTAGLRPAEYIRRLIAGHRPASIESRSSGNPRLLLELNAIGNNLNQAVRDIHAGSTRQHDWENLQGLLEIALQRVAYGDEDDVR
ncbi:plasmid mobilization protein [Planctomicrobium sp. SH668]|uniref:plasmid mobilization protein n=1 Tax=Planctomicrobium sp. SH668 TaxID=3448126 RepID=UPI003F5B8A5C